VYLDDLNFADKRKFQRVIVEQNKILKADPAFKTKREAQKAKAQALAALGLAGGGSIEEPQTFSFQARRRQMLDFLENEFDRLPVIEQQLNLLALKQAGDYLDRHGGKPGGDDPTEALLVKAVRAKAERLERDVSAETTSTALLEHFKATVPPFDVDVDKAHALKGEIDAAFDARDLNYPDIQAKYQEIEAKFMETRMEMETVYSELFHVERGSGQYHALKEQYRELGDLAMQFNDQLKEARKEGETASPSSINFSCCRRSARNRPMTGRTRKALIKPRPPSSKNRVIRWPIFAATWPSFTGWPAARSAK
jgi:hypothetical protein